MKLNIGEGAVPIDGFVGLDADKGDNAAALNYGDGTVEEVRASHILEHFGHREAQDVIKEWVRVLEPGGVLSIAVPDLKFISEQYIAGAEAPIQGWLMGGQTDEWDFHKSVWDFGSLSRSMKRAGLVGIRPWFSDENDCASLPVSLNLAGTKPPERWPTVAAVVSMPRLGFNDFWSGVYRELSALGIPLTKTTGAYWDRDLTRGIQEAISSFDPEWILTLDYDTIFSRDQILSLLDIVRRRPNVDALAPLQTARHHPRPMFTLKHPETGEVIQRVDRSAMMRGEVIKSESAHFGLTLLRVSALRDLKEPWFEREGDIDPDVNFWIRWKEQGFSLYSALRVPVGHAELMIRWPGRNMAAIYQAPSEFNHAGPPTDVWQ